MDKLLKTGLILMIAAVIIMPIAVLLKNVSLACYNVALFLALGLELIGLIFVVLNIIKGRKI